MSNKRLEELIIDDEKLREDIRRKYTKLDEIQEFLDSLIVDLILYSKIEGMEEFRHFLTKFRRFLGIGFENIRSNLPASLVYPSKRAKNQYIKK